MKKLTSLAAVIAMATAAPLVIGGQTTHGGLGTVQSVDRAKSEVTLKHDPIGSLNWPAMTMDFQVKDARVLDRLQPGTRAAFEFIADGTRYVVTSVIALADQASTTAPPAEQAHHRRMEMMMGSGAMQAMMENCMAMMKH